MDRLKKDLDHLVAEGLDSEALYKRVCKYLRELVAYRDTGLEPEAINELLHLSNGPLHKKMGKWIAADADRRLVVLPCKVGDRVFSGYGNPLDVCVSQTEGDRITQVKINRSGYHFKCWWGWFHISDIGKTVFLTRNEAEKVLEGGEHNA